MRLLRRIQEAMREVGVLLIAFAPLDVGLQGAAGNLRVLFFFLGLGLLLFIGSLTVEWGLTRVDNQ